MKIRVLFALMASLCLLAACENPLGKEADTEEIVSVVESSVEGTNAEEKKTIREDELGGASEKTESITSKEVTETTESASKNAESSEAMTESLEETSKETKKSETSQSEASAESVISTKESNATSSAGSGSGSPSAEGSSSENTEESTEESDEFIEMPLIPLY